ncbi:ADP-ribosylglycohydrolase family protein [Saccharopolyspora montiporae]|uniref:ADP-ribosylglycohydrolase family protein n=1 Tax=Saccharopolyspora montiporae TaxID=2781240 RepID=UPI00351CB06B
MDELRLDETERALLNAWRRTRRGTGDPVEQQLLATWRGWQEQPSRRPLWADDLRHLLLADPSAPVPATGLADRDGVPARAPARLLGMLLGGAAAESHALGGQLGQRSTAALFVLEGLVRAHTAARSTGEGDPVSGAVGGLRRWLHTRGVAWADCGADGQRPNGWLVAQQDLRSRSSDDPALLTAMARIGGGQPPGTRRQPINRTGSAAAVGLGPLAALWSADPGTVFALGGDLAAITHGHPDGHNPAGALAVAVLHLLRGHDLDTAVRHAITGWQAGRAPLERALRHGRLSPAGSRPARAEFDAARPGRSGLDALTVAVRAAASSPDDFAAAVRAAADHGGDTASAALVCGQLLGARHGAAGIPRSWLDRLPVRSTVERLATDAVTEFGPEPDESPDWERRYPLTETAEPTAAAAPDYRTGLGAVPRLASARERFLGAVLGCAVGEALGMPVSAENWDEIHARHGDDGLRSYVRAGHPSGRLGSDSQLLLFSLEGTIRANVARRTTGLQDPARHVQHAYQRWLHTQHLSWPRAAGEFHTGTPHPDGWLVQQRALFQTRNPGRTMMRTLIAFAKGQQPMGDPEHPVSDSRGSSAVVRSVPAALWSAEPGEVFRLGMRTAALTHGHRSAWYSAGALALLVSRTMHGDPLPAAVQAVLDELSGHAEHQEVSRRIDAAVRLAGTGPVDPPALERALGSGWTAVDALAIGLYAALAADGDFDTAVRLAVNHSGNSGTTGAVAGGLSGAWLGAPRIAEQWTAELELHEVIESLAQDAVLEFGPRPPDWADRYPAT